MVSGTHALPKYVVLEVEGGSRAGAPKGSMTYTFTHMRNFLLLLLLCIPLQAHISALRPISQPRGRYPSFEAQTPVLRPNPQS